MANFRSGAQNEQDEHRTHPIRKKTINDYQGCVKKTQEPT